MTRQTVVSSNLASIGFDSGSTEGIGTLEVEFKGGRVYRYYGVPLNHFIALMDENARAQDGDAEASVGRLFQQTVRNDFPCDRIG